VDERLRVTYGGTFRLRLNSVLGVGTCARIEIPEMVASERSAT
jgi:sensor histidine kinase YesM